MVYHSGDNMDMPAVVTTITIPGTFPDMNQIIAASKRHRSNYAKFKHTYTDLVVVVVKNRYPPRHGLSGVHIIRLVLQGSQDRS